MVSSFVSIAVHSENNSTMLILCGILIFLLSICSAWHNMDNSRFHCWPASASPPSMATLVQMGNNCQGIDVHWVRPPPKEVTQDVPFNVSYSINLSQRFFDWAIYQYSEPLYKLPNRTMNSSRAWHDWCVSHEPSVDPSDPEINFNACLWHINIHSCAIGRAVQFCGPWIPPSGEIFHSTVMAGPAGRVYESTVIIPVFGIVEIIAHFKVGAANWIHIALARSNVQVARKAVCGDKYCDMKYENCSNCPLDCGKCPLKPVFIGLIAGFAIFVIVCFVALALRTKIQEQRLLWDPSWIIDPQEVQPIRQQQSSSSTSLKTAGFGLGRQTSETNLSVTTNGSSTSCAQQIFCPAGNLRHTCVAIRKYRHKHFQLTHRIREQVRLVRTLNHSNMCKFMGASLSHTEVIIYMEYMPKGSLRDVLQNDKIPITWAFRFSFAMDILNGITYIHSRNLIHGRLNSSNCVVDQRLTIKITDYGLEDLRLTATRISSYDQSIEAYRRVYFAPERISLNELKLTPPVDIYSFGIILNEIATRAEPFGDDDAEVVLKMGYRPKIELLTHENEEDFCPLPSSYNRVVKQCIAENPFDRPTCKEIVKSLKKMCPINLTPMDLILKKMALYQTSLEQAVQVRTQELEQEKHKSENLLYSMLPKSVAGQLQNGRNVTAEYYDNCTIYFSDIVGFTTISSRCKPIDVVDFLNRVYTIFDAVIDRYDVYKIETIGDAYMVVSGVPNKNGDEHASQIATMALELVRQCSTNCKVPHSNDEQVRIRVGLHSGPVCAGVVGSKMPRYCLFGDTVNTASRMESNGEANKIHMTKDTKDLLDKSGRFLIEKRGILRVKDKGEMITYWLLEELESKTDLIFEKNLPYLQPFKLPPIYKKNVSLSIMIPNLPGEFLPSPRKTTTFNLSIR